MEAIQFIDKVRDIVGDELLRHIQGAHAEIVNVGEMGHAVVFLPEEEGSKVTIDEEALDGHYLEKRADGKLNPREFDYYVVLGPELGERIRETRDFVEVTELWTPNSVPEKYKKRVTLKENSDFAFRLEDLSVLANAYYLAQEHGEMPEGYENLSQIEDEYATAMQGVITGMTSAADWKVPYHLLKIIRAGEGVAFMMESVLRTRNIHVNSNGIEAKRVPLEGTKLPDRITFGYNDPEEVITPEFLLEKNVLMTEACVASAGTITGLALVFKALGIETKALGLFAPVSSQRGLQLFLDVTERLGIAGRVTTNEGLIRILNPAWYLVLHEQQEMREKVIDRLKAMFPEEKFPDIDFDNLQVQAVGDAGDLLERFRLATLAMLEQQL